MSRSVAFGEVGSPWASNRGLQSPVLCAYLRLPSGLEDVSKYPDLVAELLRRQWTEAEVRGALAANLLRVFEAVEQVRGLLRSPPRPPSPPRRQAAQPVSIPRRAIMQKVLRRSPSLWATWRLPAGQSTATQRPPASTSSRGPCWPPSLPSSSACVFCDTLGTKTLGLLEPGGDCGHQSSQDSRNTAPPCTSAGRS